MKNNKILIMLSLLGFSHSFFCCAMINKHKSNQKKLHHKRQTSASAFAFAAMVNSTPPEKIKELKRRSSSSDAVSPRRKTNSLAEASRELDETLHQLSMSTFEEPELKALELQTSISDLVVAQISDKECNIFEELDQLCDSMVIDLDDPYGLDDSDEYEVDEKK